MITGPVCSHFWPRLERQCDAGLRAPEDCHGCPAYYDGSAFLGVDEVDQERVLRWTALRERLPAAHFRGHASGGSIARPRNLPGGSKGKPHECEEV